MMNRSPSVHRPIRIALVLVAIAATGCIAVASADASERTVTTRLYPGWNLVGWIDVPTPPANVFEQIPQLLSIHDATDASVSRYDKPPSDDLPLLSTGQGYWFHVASATRITWQRRAQPVSRNVKLIPGEQIVAWTGRDGIPIAEALSGISDHVMVAWHWNPLAQAFTPWSPFASFPVLGGQLSYGDAILLKLTGAHDWLQPSGILPEMVLPRNLPANLVRRIEAEVRRAESFFAERFAIPIDQNRVTLYVPDRDYVDPSPPCCQPSLGWPDRVRQSDGSYRYRLVIPLSRWTETSWATPDLGDSAAYSDLVAAYFRTIQFELAGNIFDAIPHWLVHGTTVSIRDELAVTLDFDFAEHLWFNHLELRLDSQPHRQAAELGVVYVNRLIRNSHPESYMTFWRSINQETEPRNAWRHAFLNAFGVDADEFVAQTNLERRDAFSDISGQITGPGADLPTLLQVSAYSFLPKARIYYNGTISADGSYSVTLPRHYEYQLRIGLPSFGCDAFVGSDGALADLEDAAALSARHEQEEGPEVQLPDGFCRHRVVLRLTGAERHRPPGLQLEACRLDDGNCSPMIEQRNNQFSVPVPIPGSYIISLTSDLHACPSYVSASGLTTDRTQALPVDSALYPQAAVLHLDQSSQFCDLRIRGQFLGRPAEWLTGRMLRASRFDGGQSISTTLDSAGRFDLPVGSTGEYSFELLGATQHDGELLSCTVSSGMSRQWSSRTSNLLINGSYVTVVFDQPTELIWEIAPDACQYVVTGQIQTTNGEPVSNLRFVICPAGQSGRCANATSDQHGRFVFLAPHTGDVVLRPSTIEAAGRSCDSEAIRQSWQTFTIRRTADNFFSWIIPPGTCS